MPVFGKIENGLDAVDQQGELTHWAPAQRNPVQFLKQWIKEELPDRIVDFTVGMMGDYSALPTNKAIEAAVDPEFGGPVGDVVREHAPKILPGL